MARVYTDLPITNIVKISSGAPNSRETGSFGSSLTIIKGQGGTSEQRIYYGFSGFPSSLNYKRLYKYELHVDGCTKSQAVNSRGLLSFAAYYTPNYENISWNNKPEGINQLIFTSHYQAQRDSSHTFWTTDYYISTQGVIQGEKTESDATKAILKTNCLYLINEYEEVSSTIRNVSQSKLRDTSSTYHYIESNEYDLQEPFVRIYYDDSETIESTVTPKDSITSGYLNPTESHVFQWEFVSADTMYSCAGDFHQASATFYWKTNSDAEYTAVQASGSTKSVTIPANTFPSRSTIQWYVEGTDEVGTTSRTDVFSVSTTDAYISTTPLRPINSIEDGSSPINLSWTYTSPNGTVPTSYVIRYKGENDSEFTQLTYQEGSATTYSVPANTLPSGEIEWYVMMYNIDTYGHPDYCTHAKFINYAAPSAPVLSVEAVPFAKLNWQSSSQEAYEIQVGNKTYGPYFGTDKSFELPDYLENNQYAIKVRILGGFNLWSNWAVATANINNVPGSAVTLFAQSHIDTELSWETESETPDYLIFRDGKQIARTNKTFFVDRFVTGEHSYYIINKLSDGNYTKSNEIDVGAVLDAMYIALVNGGAWTKIRYHLVDQSDAGYEDSIDSTYNHLAGDVYPSATLGTYRESNVSLSVVFLYTEEEERKQFEALFGKLVIIKFKDGNVLFGVLDSWRKQARKHYWTGYTFTIRRVEWEDFVDDTD